MFKYSKIFIKTINKIKIKNISINLKLYSINSLDRIFSKPILTEEDSTDDEYDENMNIKYTHNDNDNEDGDEEIESELDDELQPLPQKRVGRELLKLGRIAYRTQEVLPEWVNQRKDEISEYRTMNQIRRCVQNWMLKPDRELQKKYASKSIGWENTAPSSIKEASRVLPYGPSETVAYVNYFMPSRYVISRRIFNEIKTFLPKYRPSRIIDFGCGPATCAAAAVDVWGNDVIERYAGIDMSQSMLDAAKIMTTSMGTVKPKNYEETKVNKNNYQKQGPDVILSNKTSDIMNRISESKNDEQRFDLAIVAYTLSELTSNSTKLAAVQVLYEMLDNNGIIVFIDNGSPIGSNNTRSARQTLLDLFGNKENLPESENHRINATRQKTKEIKYILKPPGYPKYQYEDYEVRVIAPCTHDGICPLKTGTWCSFPQRAQSSMIRKNSEEKFSYVVLQKRLKPSVALKNILDPKIKKNSEDFWLTSLSDSRLISADPTPLNIVQRYLDYPEEETTSLTEQLIDEVDFNDYNPPLVRNEYGRLIRSPIKNKSHVLLDVCQSDGFLTRSTVSKSSAWNIPHFYSAIRKLRWGGIVPVLPVSALEQPKNETKQKVETKKKSKKSDDADVVENELEPVVVLSPFSRRRPSTFPPVRRDIKPPVRVQKELFGLDEGQQKSFHRNRDTVGTTELYTVPPSNEPDSDDEIRSSDSEVDNLSPQEIEEYKQFLKMQKEDAQMADKFSKTIRAFKKDESLMFEKKETDDDDDNDDEDDEDDIDDIEIGDDIDISKRKIKELLPGYDSGTGEDITEEDKQELLNMKEEDWDKWFDILENNEKPQRRAFDEFDESESDDDAPVVAKTKKGKSGKSTKNEALEQKKIKPVKQISNPPPKTISQPSSGRKKSTPIVRRKKTDDVKDE